MESTRDVSDKEAGVEGGAATFKTHNCTSEIALQLDDRSLQYARSGTSEVVRNSAIERGDTNQVKNELKDGYECNEVKNESKDGYECKEVKNELKDGYECNEVKNALKDGYKW